MNELLRRNYAVFFLIPLFLRKSFYFFTYPRIWAEEGTVYFTSAVENGFKSIFLYQQGYYSIIPNVTLYVASLFNYSYIPYFTISISFIFWMIMFIIINNINHESIKNNLILKNSIFIVVFFIINYYQEIFLNTINLQFITGIIIFFLSLYDINKLSKNQYRLVLILICICILNGNLYLPFIPLLFYKLYNAKKYWSIGIITSIIALITIGILNQNTDLSISQRLMSNLALKKTIIIKNDLITIFKDNYYLILIPFIIYSFYKKSYFLLTLGLSILFSYLIIDFTKYENFGGRYRAFVLSILNVYIVFLLKRSNKILLLYSFTIITYFSAFIFRFSYSNNYTLPLWKNEFKNLYENKPAHIHPETWKIELKE